MNITIASGKGGTGKTTFAVNLAWTLAQTEKRVQLFDSDVEEPNSHLFIHPPTLTEEACYVNKPVWDADRCTACGKCVESCSYNALALVQGKVLLFNELCHACGVCSYVCPTQALKEQPYEMGKVRFNPDVNGLYFADGLLNVGEPSAPTVIKALKKKMDPDAITIMDAAPGTGCPVVEALEGTDVAVLVTEPTPFGLHDLKLAVSLALKLRVPTGILINRSDGDDPLIADYAKAVGVPIVGRIPFVRAYAETYSRGEMIAEKFPEMRENMLAIYDELRGLAGTVPPPAPVEEVVQVDAVPAKPGTPGTAASFRETAVISGKGGTGKTSVTAALIQLAEQSVLADNDVDAADLHLLLKPRIHEVESFFGGAKASIDPQQCVGCGKCEESCHFDAIEQVKRSDAHSLKLYQVDTLACEGCSLCSLVCPANAITMTDDRTGCWYISETDFGPMVHADLGIGQENSGKLVSCVRQQAARLAREMKLERILADGPPGTSCPVIASITDADLVLIVTEPTVSGVHDLSRVLDLSKHFGIPAAVIINKADLNKEQAQRIWQMAQQANAMLLGEIPFDRTVHDALMHGKTVLEYDDTCPAAVAIRTIWKRLQAHGG